MEELAKIEEILGVRLREYKSGEPNENTYRLRRGGIEVLRLHGVHIERVEVLLPYLDGLRDLYIRHSRVSHLAELLKISTLSLEIDTVEFDHEAFEPALLQGCLLTRSACDITIINSRVDVEALTAGENLRYLSLKKCRVRNLGALCACEGLWQLNVQDMRLSAEHSRTLVAAKERKRGRFMFTLQNCRVDDGEFFLPFAHSVASLRLYHCRLEELDFLRRVPALTHLCIDAGTTVRQTAPLSGLPRRRKKQSITLNFTGNWRAVDLHKLRRVADCFDVLELWHCRTEHIEGLELFENVHALHFEHSVVSLAPFLPLAPNIREMEFKSSELESPHMLAHFSALESVEVWSYSMKKSRRRIKTLQTLLPVSGQLRRLILGDRLRNQDCLAYFTRLETFQSLDLSAKNLQSVLQLTNLRKLSISASSGKQITADIGKLAQLEHLSLYGSSNIDYTGIERLQLLQTLEARDMVVDLQKMPKMPHLRRLWLEEFDEENSEIDGLERFPNLKELKIYGATNIRMNKPHRSLRVLDMSNNTCLEAFDFFNFLPNLEKLSLSEMYSESLEEKKPLQKMQHLKRLRYLLLHETDIKDLSGIEHLESLEYLDLYDTQVEDVRILNQLPRLKEANLCVRGMGDEEMAAQLEAPRKAVFVGLPHRYCSIWDRVEI